MSKCCTRPVSPPQSDTCCAGRGQTSGGEPLEWFQNMIMNCLAYAERQHEAGRPVVGIMCEYTPRELIMAAGAVPVCLCGGSHKTAMAAEEQLPANLCPLIKSTYGYHMLKSNPFLEMADLIVAETTCDGKKKVYELMAETRPMYVLELPQKQEDLDAREHWTRELRKFKTALEERFETVITDGKLREAIGVMNRERSLRRRLAEVMKGARPPITGRQLLEFKSSISGICEDFAQYEAALGKYEGAVGPEEWARRVRVLMTGVPIVHGAERVLDLIEQSGGLVVCFENCVGVKPNMAGVDPKAADPIVALAERYFHLPCSVMTPNEARLLLLRELAEAYRPDCIIELVWQACLTYDVEAARIQRLARGELGVPYLKIETDYSPSDSARIQTRVEALFETVRARAA